MAVERSRSLSVSRALVKAINEGLEAHDTVSVLCDSSPEWIKVERMADPGNGLLELVVGRTTMLVVWREIAAVRSQALSDYRAI